MAGPGFEVLSSRNAQEALEHLFARHYGLGVKMAGLLGIAHTDHWLDSIFPDHDEPGWRHLAAAIERRDALSGFVTVGLSSTEQTLWALVLTRCGFTGEASEVADGNVFFRLNRLDQRQRDIACAILLTDH